MRFFPLPSKVQSPTSQTVAQPFRAYYTSQPRRGTALVSAETMMSLPPFYAAMRVTAGAVADLPVLDLDGNTIDLLPETSKDEVFAAPTMHDTWFSFVDSIMWSLMIHGNAFVVPVEVSYVTSKVTSWEVIAPEYVVPLWSRAGSEATFEQGAWLGGERMGPSDFVHLKEATTGGYAWGISKLKLLSNAVGIQLSEQAHVKGTYDDGAQPTGYFSTKEKMDSTVAKAHSEVLAAALGGRGSDVVLVPDGIEWQAIQLNHADIQLLEARRWSTTEAAMIMGVPAHLIGGATYDSDTYSSVRMDMAAYEALTLSRYKRILEQGFSKHGMSFTFGRSELAQPTRLEQVQATQLLVQCGIQSPAQAAETLGLEAPPEPTPVAPPDDDTGKGDTPMLKAVQ